MTDAAHTHESGQGAPLSHAQQRLWLVSQLQPHTSQYNFPYAIRLRGRLDVPTLERALSTIVSRHEILRSSFGFAGDEPFQLAHPARPLHLPLEDLSSRGPASQQDGVESALREEWQRPFDLATAPLLRARLIRLASHDHVFIRNCHHIVFDASSNRRFNAELAMLYDAFAAGAESPLPPLPAQYADFARWQRRHVEGNRLAEGIAYWKTQLAGIPEPFTLSPDHAPAGQRTFAADECEAVVGAGLMGAVRELARRERATPYMVLLAAFAIVLARQTGDGDVVFGSPITDRGRPEFDPLVGLFVNLLVLRLRVDPAMRCRALISEARRTAMAAYRHHDVPFERIVREGTRPRSLADVSPVQTFLVYHENPAIPSRFASLRAESVAVKEARARFDVVVYANEEQDRLGLTWCYATEVFERRRIERMSAELLAALEALAGDPDRQIGRLQLSAADDRRGREGWNDTATACVASTVPALCARQARRTPDATAVVCAGQHLSYRALDARASGLARLLSRRGVSVGHLVGIAIERSLDAVVGVLATLKVGAAYLPLDPDYPPARLSSTCADARPAVLLTRDGASCEWFGGPTVAIGAGHGAVALERSAEDEDAGAPPLTPWHSAYVMYTSGSTGAPKGVVVSHRGVCNLIDWLQADMQLAGDDHVLHKTPLGFDVSVWEMLWPLSRGATIVIARPGGHKDPDYLLELLCREQVTTLHFVPSMLQALVDHPAWAACVSLRRVLIGGEALSSELAARLHRQTPAALYHLYGPTEATVDVCCHPVPSEPSTGRVPIGTPIANTRLSVLDASLQATSVGAVGELYIGGAGLADGYHRRPGLTAARFVADPLGSWGTRLYRTGDRVRRRADGALEFIGRADNQVKVRGHRVELEEIEAVLGRCEGVAQAVVAAGAASGDRARLVAHVAPLPGVALDATALREELQRLLPDYMVPAAITCIDTLPLTPHGKVDRQALRHAPTSGGPPRTPGSREEGLLCELFAAVLALDRVGPDENFFELGGDSLNAVRLLTRIRADFGLRFSVDVLADAPTPSALAAILAGSPQKTAAALRVVPLRARGTLPPLFCLPAAAGLGWAYLGLLRAVDGDRPLYCIEPAALRPDADRPLTIAAMADDCVDALRGLSAGRGYRLVGWSFGGVLAHAVACRLQQRGDDVDLLAVLDGYPATAVERNSLTRPPWLDEQCRHIDEGFRRILGASQAETSEVHALIGRAYDAHRRHIPERFAGDMLLFTAAGDMPRPEAWTPYVMGRISVHRCDCRHLEMTDAAQSLIVGRVLEAELRARVAGAASREGALFP
jgi:nonribosomal peptide synthetase DhbF